MAGLLYTPHFRVTWLFDMVNEPEEAATGLNVRPPDGSPTWDAEAAWATVGQPTLDACDTAMATLLAPAGNGVAFASWARYVGVKIAYITQTGEYGDSPKIKYRSTPVIGDQAGFVPQQTLVVSLRSTRTFGRATKGRMFIPYVTAASWSDGTAPRLGQSYVNAFAIHAANFVRDVRAAFNVVEGDPVPCIMSTANEGGPDTRASNAVTSVRVGDVFDTQRRRRNRMVEQYVTQPVP